MPSLNDIATILGSFWPYIVSTGTGLLFGTMTARNTRRLVAAGLSDGATLTQAILHRNSLPKSLYGHYTEEVPSIATLVTAAPVALLRLDPLAVDAARILLSCVSAAVGLTWFTQSLGGPPIAGILATVALLGSNMSNQGYYLRAALGTSALHGQMAPAFGTIVLAGLLAGRIDLALLGGGLLLSYHPVHGAIITMMIASYLAIRPELMSGASIVLYACLWMLGVAPLLAYVLGSARRRTALSPQPRAYSAEQFMKWLKLRQYTTLFALSGLKSGWGLFSSPVPRMFVFVGLTAGALILGLINSAHPTATTAFDNDAAAKVAVIVAVSVALFCANVVLVDILQLDRLAPVALSRSTVYPVIVGIGIWASIAAIASTTGPTGLLATILTLAIVTVPPWQDHSVHPILAALPLLQWLPAMAPGATFVNLSLVMFIFVAYVLRVALKVRATDNLWSRAFTSLFAYNRDAFPIACFSFAAFLGAANSLRLTDVGSFLLPIASAPTDAITSLAVTGGLVAIAVTMGAWHVWRRSDDIWRAGGTSGAAASSRLDDWIEVQEWARANTAPGSLFVTPPYMSAFEALSRRPCLLGMLEMTFPLYARELFPEVLQRIRDFGVDPLALNAVGKGPLSSALREAFDKLGVQDLMRLADKYGAGYAVLERGTWQTRLSTRMPSIFSNDSFVVLSLDRAALGLA